MNNAIVDVLTLGFSGIAAVLGIWLFVQRQMDRHRRLKIEREEEKYQRWLEKKENALREKKVCYQSALETGGQPAADAVGSPTVTATAYEMPYAERAIRENRLMWWDASKHLIGPHQDRAAIER